MDRRGVFVEELRMENEKLENLNKKLVEADSRYASLCGEIDELNDKLNCEKQIPVSPKIFAPGKKVCIIAIIVGFFVNKIISVVGILAFIALLIYRSSSIKKQQNKNEILLAPTKEKLRKLQEQKQQMNDQYPHLCVLGNQISKVKNSIKTLQNKIDMLDNETTRIKTALGTNDISRYEKNYVFIHISDCFNKNLSTPHVFYNHRLYIDGQDFGFANLPFVKFEMNPGVHMMKIEYTRGDYFYSTNVIQFRVDEQSKMYTFKYKGSSKGGLEIKEYSRFDQFSTFLDETAKK